jgi:recombinational DNA repair protein (RecF pathway)
MSYITYVTDAIVIRKKTHREVASSLLLFTRDHGVVWATAEGLSRATSKLVFSLLVGSYSSVRLIRGRAGYRIIGATEKKNLYYLSKDDALNGDYTTFQLLVASFKALQRFYYSEHPEPLLFDDLVQLLLYSKKYNVQKPDLLVHVVVLYHLGYIDGTIFSLEKESSVSRCTAFISSITDDHHKIQDVITSAIERTQL